MAKVTEPKERGVPPPLDEATVRRVVFQTFGRARRTQDSPIVPEVWLKFIRLAERRARARIAKRDLPSDRTIDLLLSPQSGSSPGEIAAALRRRLLDDERRKEARIAQGTSQVVARLDFETLVRVVVPMSGWWRQLRPEFRDPRTVRDWLAARQAQPIKLTLSHAGTDIEFLRYAALVGFIGVLENADSVEALKEVDKLAKKIAPPPFANASADQDAETDRSDGAVGLEIADVVRLLESYSAIYAHDEGAAQAPPPSWQVGKTGAPEIFQINLNRPAAQSLFDSRLTVKADAANRVFEISTEGIAFAVIDCGIDATHPAFLKRPEGWTPDSRGLVEKSDIESLSRVAATYDFTVLRDILASASDGLPAAQISMAGVKSRIDQTNFELAMAQLKIRSERGRDLDWEIVEPLIRIPHDKKYQEPCSDHGTHVAGILAANMEKPVDSDQPLFGMCRQLTLYDLRVFDTNGDGDEFAILCALEFVGWLNRNRQKPIVHGVNLSLALRHDVDSFACGQTPVCDACNHLVGAGTVVVAAAGNSGFDNAAGKQNLGGGYRMMSITDPGNAESVITVGSTHRRDPHAYGVSYFSARGPTGDGRRKPDILAPGEKITSTIRDGRSQRMDGTSMAAPHVGGAAALLMARYPELIGHPARIKEILMRSATDLGREPYFQGAGLLDILRALQSV